MVFAWRFTPRTFTHLLKKLYAHTWWCLSSRLVSGVSSRRAAGQTRGACCSLQDFARWEWWAAETPAGSQAPPDSFSFICNTFHLCPPSQSGSVFSFLWGGLHFILLLGRILLASMWQQCDETLQILKWATDRPACPSYWSDWTVIPSPSRWDFGRVLPYCPAAVFAITCLFWFCAASFGG